MGFNKMWWVFNFIKCSYKVFTMLVSKIPCQTFLAVVNTILSKATAAGIAAPGLSSVGVATLGTVGFITFILGMSIAAGITLFKATRRTPLNAVEEAQLNKARNDVIMNAASIQLASTGQLMLKDLEHRKKMVELLKSCVTLKSNSNIRWRCGMGEFSK